MFGSFNPTRDPSLGRRKYTTNENKAFQCMPVGLCLLLEGTGLFNTLGFDYEVPILKTKVLDSMDNVIQIEKLRQNNICSIPKTHRGISGGKSKVRNILTVTTTPRPTHQAVQGRGVNWDNLIEIETRTNLFQL